MRKFKWALSFILLSLTAYSLDPNRVNTKADKLAAIDQQINELMLKKESLEKLKKQFTDEEFNLNAPLPVKNRPKVGLVLSGGGAKGAAHIGVLKVLEKYKIPIDYVVGTSAGSIIAAMYSAGYTPDEIEKTVVTLKFNKLLSNSSDRTLKNIVDKASSNKYPLTLSITKDFELSLPMGVLTGEFVYLQLKEIFAKAESVENFDELPIPFRAMTTNLQTGQSVAIGEGDLALATLKSMAIPTFLDPIRDGDNYYVDGGVVDNFPVLEAINMGADIVIAIDISAETINITDSSNIIAVLDKLSTYNGNTSTEKQKKLADILITPGVKTHSTLDFDNLDSLVQEGAAAAEELDYILKNLSDEVAYNEIRAKGEKLVDKPREIKNVKIYGSEILTEKTVMKLKPEKQKMGVNELNLWAEKIYALNYVDRVFYHVTGDTAEFIVREKTDSKIGAGISYVSEYGGALEVMAEIPILGLTKKKYTVKAELSKYPKLALRDITQYEFLRTNFIVSGDISYGLNPLFIYSNGNNISTYNTKEFVTNLSFGTTLFDKAIIGYSLGFKSIDSDYDSGVRLNKLKKFKRSGSYVVNAITLYTDTLNKSSYPSEGIQIFGQGFSGTSVDSEDNYQGYGYSGLAHIMLTSKLSINTNVIGGKILNSDEAPLSELFSLGGLRNNGVKRKYEFYGLPLGSVYTNDFLIGGFGIQYSIFDSLNLLAKYNIGTYNSQAIAEEKRNIWEDSAQGYGVGLGWDTFLGPMDFVLSNNIDGSGVLYQVNIGYTF
ncbi:patatin-like phospholipase family protein [Cetobacterium sp. 2A]|uniref:patatin-like phospholipase family protein n=1 Tax=Cetobacterium sp. 2A TaxID=2754723 RepID=UPI00163C6F44|nr:patatin-like phospholipase family protein [Cetobacterium sp. 2A]MBC2855543.1 patatin-like phospholipase family protein [Cetobacterium sp. 2A]